VAGAASFSLSRDAAAESQSEAGAASSASTGP
jgi:hypothetical protein